MSSHQCNVELRRTDQNSTSSSRYAAVGGAIIVPVFCVCMIAAMGTFSSIRQATIMQFEVDVNTEFIASMTVINIDLQQKIIEENI